MTWGVTAAAAATVVGGAMQGRSSEKAARTSAAAQENSARIAADEARFRPIGITTGFGSSRFGTDAEGRVNSAGYDLNPQLAGLRDQLLGQTPQGMNFAQQGLGAAQGLFGLGQQYLSQSPQAAAQQWMNSQQAALSPGREQAMSNLMNRLTQTGTQGLGVAQAGGGQANPLMQAFANAQAQQDLGLAAQAQEQGRSQTQFGQGLLTGGLNLAAGAYSPLNAMLQQAQGIESLGQSSLDIGAQLGGRVANPTGADALMRGGMGAAQSLQQANSYNPVATALQGLGSNQQFMNGMFRTQRSGSAPQAFGSDNNLYNTFY